MIRVCVCVLLVGGLRIKKPILLQLHLSAIIQHLLTLLSSICSLFYLHYFFRHYCFVRVVGSWAWNWMEPPLGQVKTVCFSLCLSLTPSLHCLLLLTLLVLLFFMLFVRGARSRSSCSACSLPGLKLPTLVFGLIRPSSRPCVPIKLCESSLSTMRLCWPIIARV